MGALAAAYSLGGVTLAVPGLPLAASWVLIGVACMLLTKLIVLYIARRSLERLGSLITAAAAAARTP
jgi:uncharacterized membrane protein